MLSGRKGSMDDRLPKVDLCRDSSRRTRSRSQPRVIALGETQGCSSDDFEMLITSVHELTYYTKHSSSPN